MEIADGGGAGREPWQVGTREQGALGSLEKRHTDREEDAGMKRVWRGSEAPSVAPVSQ